MNRTWMVFRQGQAEIEINIELLLMQDVVALELDGEDVGNCCPL